MREVGQRCDGQFQASKSKTFAAPISRLYRSFSVKRTRGRWLPDVDLKIRTSTVDKSMRMTWPDGTSVNAYFTAKGPKKSQVAIQHVGLSKNPLLIMHGKNDPRVHPSQSMELYRHLKQHGKTPVRLVFYPGEGHGNRKSAGRYDYNVRMLRWFEHYLKGAGGDPPPHEIDYGFSAWDDDEEDEDTSDDD